MPIAALPPTTARAIGSASVISDPCSIVKELLDNALDASATSVTIEISPNTIDVVQVRDNGTGISCEDHPFVCRRSFTSKIQTVDDLRHVGGTWLGFRGEALASAAEVSSSLVVTTRVENESIGHVIRYGRDGELVSTQFMAHPVGTTVRIADLFRHIPVRRQTVLKSSAKTLVRIKKMLQAYALAQPSKRLSLKVLRAKNESNNWLYAPGQEATLSSAAMKVAGKEVASNCCFKRWEDDVPDGSEDRSRLHYELTAFLPDPEADIARVNNSGQYISIDGRPLSATRGIGQDIAKLFKTYINSVTSRRQCLSNVTDPFLCLHIRCYDATYDVNIEPAKDDVLLEDPQTLLSLIEDMFRSVYGAQPDTKESPGLWKGKAPVKESNGFDLLLARKSPSAATQSMVTYSQPSGFVTANSVWKATPPSPNVTLALDADNMRRKRLEALNPWSFTKMNVGSVGSSRTPSQTKSPFYPPLETNIAESRRDSVQSIHHSPQTLLPSPSASSTSTLAVSPLRAQISPTRSQNSHSSPERDTHSSARRAARERDRERYGNGSLDTWFGKTTQVAMSRLDTSNQPQEDTEEPSLSALAARRFEASDETSQVQQVSVEDENGSPMSAIGLSRMSSLSPPPTQDIEIQGNHRGLPVLERWSTRLHQLSKDSHKELEKALDFERRKRDAIQERRKQLQNSHVASNPRSPHLNRYLNARAALSSDAAIHGLLITELEQKQKPALSPHDPRSYLIRYHAQNAASDGRSKLKRISTNKLPFESISEECALYDTGITVSTDLSQLAKLAKGMVPESPATNSTTESDALSTFGRDSPTDLWSQRLNELIQAKYEAPTNVLPLHFNFSATSYS
ncbi:putative DNA mismatch repair protein [Aspergillus saccharolyticus JOP 1030-1]|uniref:DNA mismatch repair protein S5 domain-containing protein n=1 Tax=Aspergillus saccharolyticus JOP 1030-1 TaxID=1450539 RepID=A0A318Z2N9_9EURO|nr:hypothetical protein BP01DRAFT_349734 [Aspergillus saccharolyticus JOP 1030-1]PYH41249.1 hypothetical protein BP01DRAFT_349734 [Aspergillus saccharolyticus JOP 1030-1]